MIFEKIWNRQSCASQSCPRVRKHNGSVCFVIGAAVLAVSPPASIPVGTTCALSRQHLLQWARSLPVQCSNFRRVRLPPGKVRPGSMREGSSGKCQKVLSYGLRKGANTNRNVKPITAQNTEIKAKFWLLYGYLHIYDSENKGKFNFTHPFKAVLRFWWICSQLRQRESY